MSTNPRAASTSAPSLRVHDALGGMVEKDLSVLLVSSELPELMGMADRIIIMRLGEIVAEFDREDFDAEMIAAYATGAKKPQTQSHDREVA